MPFVPGIVVEGDRRTLYVAGATALPLYHKHPHDPKELEIPSDIKEQTRRVLENIRMVVEAAGAKMENIVTIKKYLTRMQEDQDAIAEVLVEYFGENLPTSTTIEVKSLVVKDARLEIDAIAVF